MIWRMRIGHYELTTVVTLEGGCPSTAFETGRLHRQQGFPRTTDEDLFRLTFHEFSRSVKVARLDECPLTPREVYDRGAAIWAQAQEAKVRSSRERGERRRAMNDYLEFCDELYDSWLEGRLAEAGWEEPELLKELTSRTVNLYFAPEPYLVFDEIEFDLSDSRRLIFLTTNPGSGEAYQTRNHAKTFNGYRYFQTRLTSSEYDPHREGEVRPKDGECRLEGTSLNRVQNMRSLAEHLNERYPVDLPTNGFVQCECIPFRSNSLPGKHSLAKYLQNADSENPLVRYIEHLKAFLSHNHVIALDAAHLTAKEVDGSRLALRDEELWATLERGIDEAAEANTRWIVWKSERFGFDPSRSRPGFGDEQYLRLGKEDGAGVRFYGYWTDEGLLRGYYLAQGGNNFGPHSREIVGYLGEPPSR